jgi:hypothetical protein
LRKAANWPGVKSGESARRGCEASLILPTPFGSSGRIY